MLRFQEETDGFDVVVQTLEVAESNERNIGAELRREWVPAGNAGPWIFKTAGRARQRNDITPWRRLNREDPPLHRQILVAHTIRSANRCAAVTLDIPCEAEPRTEFSPAPIESGFTRRKSGVAGIIKTCGSILEDGALDTLRESVVVEAVYAEAV